ncbi:hypothetical protein SH661x_001920 [Planctomicrobium sp. SH661]|uniref:hypothetical protein n=1 Tax=Planctomicrobium sp. SH661 TaxID=3448124 RepID=UPI003F5BEF50
MAFDRPTLFMTMSALQLARRHPAFPGNVSGVIDSVIEGMQGLMRDDIAQIAAMGQDPSYDIPVEELP